MKGMDVNVVFLALLLRISMIGWFIFATKQIKTNCPIKDNNHGDKNEWFGLISTDRQMVTQP